MASCYKCGWEGEDGKMKERPANLLFYDHLLKDKIAAEITRKEYICPICGEVLSSKRLIDGMVFSR